MRTNLFFALVGYALMANSLLAQQTFNVDLNYNNDPIYVSTGNWNNFTGSTLGTTLSNLINDQGTASTYGMEVTDDFVAANSNGTTTPDAGLIFPDTATRDSFYVQDGTNTTGGITLSGLDITKYYSFVVFASRNGVSDIRESQYTMQGTNTVSAVLNASNNTGNTVSINNVRPDATGNIVITLNKGAGNTNGSGFCYIGAFQMKETSSPLSVEDVSFEKSISIYPNPVVHTLQVQMELKNNANLNIQLMDANGKLISILYNQFTNAGLFHAIWSKSELGNSLMPGIYILSIRNDVHVMTQKLIIR